MNATLKLKMLIVLLIFAIVPAVIVGAIGTAQIVGFENNAKLDTLSTVSLSKSAAVEQVFSNYISAAGALSKTEMIINTAKSGSGDAEDMLKAYTGSNKDYLDALVIDASGAVVASATGKNGGSFEHFGDSMPTVSPVLSWQNYGEDAFFVSKEIYENPGSNNKGAKVGYVCMVVSVGSDSGLVKSLSGSYLNDKANVTVFDSEGNIINLGGTGALQKNGQADGALMSALNSLRDKTINTPKNLSENIVKGTAGKYTYAGGIIPGVNSWRWAGVVESSAMNAFSTGAVLIGWGVILVASGIASLIAYMIVNNFIKNLHDMLKTMGEISEGNGTETVRFEVKNHKSELGEIQSSFNDLLDEMVLSSERHRTIAELSDSMLFEWDFQKERMYVSDNVLAKFDVNTTDATLSNGRFLDALMSPEHAEKYKRDINTMLKNKNGFNAEYQLKNKNGALVWVSLRAQCVPDRITGELKRVIGVMMDIDNDKKNELQLAERASYDFLSQLYNRSTFIRNFTQELERRGTSKIACMFLDVDDFKFINDRYGHTIGDEVIKYVADTIRTKVEDRGGFAGRFGGDEFVLCFTNQEDIENIEYISDGIINELYEGYTASDGTIINVKISIGIAFCPEHSEKANELLSFADTAMYFVKKHGKTNYHIYEPEDTASGEYIDPEF